jgi:outer membrane cobalamin receptor
LHNTGYGFKSTYQKATEDCEVNYTNGNKADAYYAAVIAPIIKNKLHAKVRYDLYRANGEWNKANTLYEVGADYEFTKNFQINAEYALVNNRANTADKNSNMIDVQVDFKF